MPVATNDPYVYIYDTFWLEIRNHNYNYIWKTSDFIHALQDGWASRNLRKGVFCSKTMFIVSVGSTHITETDMVSYID